MSRPCHALGGARHRCNSTPVAMLVRFNGGHWGAYTWCRAAVDQAYRDADQAGERVEVRRPSGAGYGPLIGCATCGNAITSHSPTGSICGDCRAGGRA